ncbi:hypothetical protein JCM13369A_17430 [Mediterraneibacter glycyrrhizinilyticus JCM 13369]
MSETIMKIDHISKFYPGVTALNDVSFEIKKGEVHALCGENGAGKSTLIKCIMGVEKPDKGKVQMNYNGEWIVNANALEAQSHGVFANYQHVNIAQDLSIAENYFLGRQPKTKLGLVDWKKMQDDTRKIIDKFEMNVNPNEKIKTLPIAMQAMVTISKISVNDDIRVVIFDEPTALLENEKVEILFKFIAELKEKGVSIIYISHRLEEVMDICDTVTVLKDGTYVDTKPISAVTKDSLIAMMVGREMSDIYNIGHQKPGEEVLRVENFSDSSHFKDINFNLKKRRDLRVCRACRSRKKRSDAGDVRRGKTFDGRCVRQRRESQYQKSERRHAVRDQLFDRGPENGRTCASASDQDEYQYEFLCDDQQGRRDLSESGTGPRSGLFKAGQCKDAERDAACG